MMEVSLPETTSEGLKPHIAVFPYPAQGHLLPLLDLTHQLCLRDVTVSVIFTPGNVTHLSSLISAHPSTVSTVVFPFPPHPCEGDGSVPDPNELGRVIVDTMGEGGREVTARAEEIRQKTAAFTAGANGSSIEDLQRLVKEFEKL